MALDFSDLIPDDEGDSEGQAALGQGGEAFTPAAAPDINGLKGNDRWRAAYQHYRAKGYDPVQASGIVGGLRGETESLDPEQVHDGGIGLGISGWNGDRLKRLGTYAKSNGRDPLDVTTQLDFVDHELGTTESGARDRLLNAETPEQAGDAMLGYFRPKNYNVPGAHPERAQYAGQFYNSFAGEDDGQSEYLSARSKTKGIDFSDLIPGASKKGAGLDFSDLIPKVPVDQVPLPKARPSQNPTVEMSPEDMAAAASGGGEPAAPGIEPTTKDPEFGGYASVAGKGLARGATDIAGQTFKGAELAADSAIKPIAPEDNSLIEELSKPQTDQSRATLMGLAAKHLPKPVAMDYNAALQRIATGSDPATESAAVTQSFQNWNAQATAPTKDRPLYKAGEAVEQFGKKNLPLTPTEEQSVTGQTARAIGGMAPLVAGGLVLGPAAGLIGGAGVMAASFAGQTYDDAKAKGANDQDAAKAAGLSAIVGGGLGVLPLGVILKPVTQSAPGLTGWAAAKLEQALQSGVTFAGIGEAQHYLAQEIAKNFYDPTAHYDFDPKRVVSGLLAGGVLGAAHPLSEPGKSSPEEIDAFLKAAREGPGAPEPPFSKDRADIDEFLRRKAAEEAAGRPRLSGPETGADEPSPPPPEAAGPAEGETPSSPAVSPTERRMLRKSGYTDDQIDAMSRPEAEAELGSAAEQGIKPEPESQAPSTPDFSDLVPAKAEGAPAPGFVRFYHGGDQESAGADGARWLTPDLKYAEGYAKKGSGKVYYVDIPENSPLLHKSFDDSGTDQKAAYTSFNAPDDIARNLKPLNSGQKPAAPLAPDTPTAEPASDISAQARDLKDPENPRLAVWLPRATVEHLNRTGALKDMVKAGPRIINFDGQGGILVAKDKQTLAEAKRRRDRGDDIQSIVGQMTGAGSGKPADATDVVQQQDDQGNVTRESAVSPGQESPAAQDMAEPGRQVEQKPAGQALSERQAKVTAEQAVTDALKEIGIGPEHIDPKDHADAVKIVAETGANPSDALEQAVIKNAVADGTITHHDIAEVYGNAVPGERASGDGAEDQNGREESPPQPAKGDVREGEQLSSTRKTGEQARAEADLPEHDQANRADQAGGKDRTDSADLTRGAAGAEPERTGTDQSGVARSASSRLAETFSAHLRDGGEFKSILAARKMAKESGFDGDAKAVEEAMELAVVKLARDIVQGKDDPKAKFTALVDLYSRQPKLGTRTSTSMRDQAFSTPVPLAYVASRLADIGRTTTIYEPTAGNGALLIEANPKNTDANEINPARADNLAEQGFTVSRDDATLKVPARKEFDRVIANPPFGPLKEAGESKVFDLSGIQKGYRTKEIDHSIALKALDAMKDDGKAVLLLGGLNKLTSSPEGRSDGYNGKAKREFYKTLYDRYNVTDHFTVAGELYDRQGAGWPVDVIAIDGRGKSKRALPAVDVPRVLNSWDQLGGILDADAVPRSDRGEVDLATERSPESGPGRRDEDLRPDVGGSGLSQFQPENGERGDVQHRPVQRSGNEDAGGEGRAERPQRNGSGLAERTDLEPVAERRPHGLTAEQAVDSALDEAFGPQAGPKSSEDRITAVAVRDKTTGKVWSGPEPHSFHIEDAAEELGVPFEKAYDDGRFEDGFLTNTGRFVSRDDAAKIALDADQVHNRNLYEDELGPYLQESDLKPGELSEPIAERPAREVAANAVKNATQSADAAFSGLYELFGGSKASSGFTFDEDTYAKAKPLFEEAAGKFSKFKDDIAELAKRMVAHMRDTLAWPREVFEKMKPYLVRFIQDVQKGAVKLGGEERQPVEKTKSEPAPKEQETDKQVAYAPKSGVEGLGTLVPVNMRTPIADSLNELHARVGDLDQYVAKQLGYKPEELEKYFAAEQIDALALAIDNLERGKGFIIGDQTGIGKGRVNAAIIRWAIENKRVPIFVTEKPNLYRDMYRDLSDIGIQDYLGREPNIIATNSDLNVPLTDDGNLSLRTGGSSEHKRLLQSLRPDKIASKYDVVFTTYAQMQTVKGEETARRVFLGQLAPNAVLIFDESHNAGGQGQGGFKTKGPSNRSGFARELVENANGVFYSSATYAKRPDVMDLYAATDMAMAVEKIEDLAEAIARGGVPMQQAVAAMLAKAGQYIRRERSFAGVTYDTPSIPVNKEQYDGISSALAAIQEFSLRMKDAAKALDQEIKAQASAISQDNATGGAGASSTLFTSIMHNIINQMLLAMKAKPAGAMAIEAIKKNQKPVVTVSNTMESFLSDYAEAMGIKHGEEMDVHFGGVLQKYLDRTRTLILKKPFSDIPVEHKYLSDQELGEGGLARYNEAKKLIENLDLSDLPVSPIDRIKQDLGDAGYKVGEITGRGTILDYSGNAPVIRSRPGKETSIKGRIETINQFNSGGYDALILNQSGATGLSVHASKTFQDQRQRHMMIAQAEGNIDTHMQMLGRVHRTGQVVVPTYSQLVADIPAEKRPAAVLAKKMASLNANTTASRGGALTAKDVPDFLNEYGDLVAATIISDDLALNHRMGDPVKIDENGRVTIEDAMRRLTGRIPLLPLQEQEDLYRRLEDDYAALLEQMEASGENALEAKTLDLKARPLERTEVVPAKKGSNSPFAAPVHIEKTSIVRQGKPFATEELAQKLFHALNADEDAARTTKDNALAALADFDPRGLWGSVAAKEELARRNAALDEFGSYQRGVLDGIEDPARLEKERTKLNAVKDRFTALHEAMPTGARITLKTSSGNITGIVLKTERTGQAKNPLALSSWKATIAVADAARQVTLPFSRLYEDQKSPSDEKTAIEVRQIGWEETPAQTIDRFTHLQNSAREERFIATGNLLAAYDWLGMKGRIINYTDEQGHIRQGILTAKDFDLKKQYAAKGRTLREPADVVSWLKNNRGKLLWSEDQALRLNLDGSGRFYITTDAAKKTGGAYFLDQKLTDITRDFYKRGNVMVADIYDPSDATLKKIVGRLQDLGAVFTDRNETPPPKPEKIEQARSSIAPSSMTPKAEKAREAIQRAVLDAVAQVAGPESARRTMTPDNIDLPAGRDWNLAQGQEVAVTGSYFPGRETSGVDPLIMVALAGNRDAVRTAYHEGWHAIEGTLTRDEVNILKRETPRLRDYAARNSPHLGDEIRQAEPEEVWAEAASIYTAQRENGESISGIHIAVRRMFEKVRALLARIKNALAGLGFKSADDIFAKFARGEMGRRRESLPRDMLTRYWDGGEEAPRSSVRRRKAEPGDLVPGPESFAQAWDPSVPFKQRLSDTIDALMLKPSRALWDRQIDLLRFQKAAEAMGKPVPENLDMYLAASLYPGHVGEKMKDVVKALWEPLYDEMHKRGVGRDELHDYLYARHAPERNAKIREIDPDNDAGSGMTDVEASEIMGSLIDRKADFEAVAKLADKIVVANREVMLREGLEGEKTIENWEKAYEHYVPLRGFESGPEDEFGSPTSGRGFDVRRPESMRALGRFDRADDILTNLLDQTQRTIMRAEKNRVAKTALRFMQANPSPFYKIGLAEKKRRVDPLTGLVEEYWSNVPTHLDRVFAAKVGGKTYYVEIKHDGLLEALKTLGADKMNPFIRLMARLTREYSRFQTGKNPEFVFTNLVKDLQDAAFSVSAEQRDKFTKRFVANILNGRAMFGAILGTFDKGETAQARKWFEEWRAAGGKISHYGLKDMETLRKEIEKELGQRAESTGRAVALAAPRFLNPINGTFVKWLEHLSDVTETHTRLAVYIAAREAGMTKALSAHMSRNATVDFNRKGKYGTAINSLYAFANAGVQGNVRLLRLLRRSKAARRAALGLVVAGLLTTFWNVAMSKKDEEGKSAYEKRKYWERERNILIYPPGSDVAAKIPIGYGLNIFWMMGEQLSMRTMGKVGTLDAIGNWMGTTVDAFNPIGSGGSFFDLNSWARNMFPTVFRPVPELALNQNFAGNKIHPDETPWTHGLPHSSQHKGFTHPAAVSASDYLNRLTGGNRFEPGTVDLYPDSIEYGWNFAVGGLGRFLANTSGTIADSIDGVDRPVERIPFVRRFVASDNSPAVSSDAYYKQRTDVGDNARRLRAAMKARQSGEDDGSSDAVIEKLAPQLGAAPSRSGKGVSIQSESVFRNADKQIKDLRQQEDAIRKDDSVSRGEREQKIRGLRDQMRDIMGEARRSSSPQQ